MLSGKKTVTGSGRVVGRYAPSPSGELHLGNLRTAVVAFLAAKQADGSFILRVDDLDRDRDKGFARAQQRDLELLGIHWDKPPVKQQSRDSSYSEALEQLTAAGLVYPCWCSRKDILAAPTAPHSPPGAYPGTCRELSNAERAEKNATLAKQPALRVNAAAAEISVCDAIHGEYTGCVDDFVLRRGDGVFAYNLATVVDDADSGVTQVVRGADLLESTPRQIWLQQRLGYQTPEYAHVPLVVNACGQRLAKRDGAVTLQQFLSGGGSVPQLMSWFAKSLNIPAQNPKTVTDLLAGFALERIGTEPLVWQPGEPL
ncbi:tRNA glutamyl-Q(34) synthetase GluQRS [Leucobacter sp. OH1287]|uniref:tRNA glutamyl-Q(34) synthetase GluQRS n=1 Tax=Leucobacter sp. OH1287 TaxID=2491049 RepID=UPI001F1D65F2|nr:tRNA glutamyl-Q(34) synthetase GluQRS [Leucobacter sp. OH1287]